MGKLDLRRQLRGLTAEQMQQVILDAYDARKEIKEYFDYFLNPDPQALIEKFMKAAHKELTRTRRGGYSKARISYFRKMLKEFDAFQPGWDSEIEVRLQLLERMLEIEKYIDFGEPMIKGAATLANELLAVADRNEAFPATMERLQTLLLNEDKGTRSFRSYITRNITLQPQSLANTVKP